MVSGQPETSRTKRLQQLFNLAAGQAGHFTAAQARALGYSARSLHHHVVAGHLERVGRGFYRLVGVPSGAHEDVVAAWLRFATRGAVVSHDTALALYDLAPTRSREIHLTLPREHRPRSRRIARGIKLHTTTTPLRRDEVAKRFAVEVTAPARTIVDVGEVGGDPSVVIEATTRALVSGLVTVEELLAASKARSARVRTLVQQAITQSGADA